MFCRFGSELEAGPVAATVWLKEVCMRPVSGSTSAGSASTYVDLSFASCRYSRIFARQRMLRGEPRQHVDVGREAGLALRMPSSRS